jgi:CheY-like chemotaxis protein
MTSRALPTPWLPSSTSRTTRQKYSVIIPDVKMPSMTGSELANRAKKIKPDIRVRSVAKKQKLHAKNSIRTARHHL